MKLRTGCSGAKRTAEPAPAGRRDRGAARPAVAEPWARRRRRRPATTNPPAINGLMWERALGTWFGSGLESNIVY